MLQCLWGLTPTSAKNLRETYIQSLSQFDVHPTTGCLRIWVSMSFLTLGSFETDFRWLQICGPKIATCCNNLSWIIVAKTSEPSALRIFVWDWNAYFRSLWKYQTVSVWWKIWPNQSLFFIICFITKNHQLEVKKNRQTIPGWWFQPTPLKNMSSSVGIMKFPTEWNLIIHPCSKPPTRSSLVLFQQKSTKNRPLGWLGSASFFFFLAANLSPCPARRCGFGASSMITDDGSLQHLTRMWDHCICFLAD